MTPTLTPEERGEEKELCDVDEENGREFSGMLRDIES